MTISDLKTLDAGSSKTANKMPVLFIGHGNPMNALYDNLFTQSLKRTGNIVHNLKLSFKSVRERGEEFVYDWVVEFDQWAKEKIDNRDINSLINYENAGESGKLSVPTIDHYVPMLYSLALADKNENIIYTHEEVTFGAMSMRCFKIE